MTATEIAANIRCTTFAASAAFAKYTAAEQRSIFGAAIFGQKSLRWNSIRNRVETRVSTIGRDYDVQSYTLDEIAALVESGRKASKGWNGTKDLYWRTF